MLAPPESAPNWDRLFEFAVGQDGHFTTKEAALAGYALMLHNLSDALPRKVNLTLPTSWAKRRLRVPKGVRIHHADLPRKDRIEIGAVPVTNVRRTLIDCAGAHVSPELVEAAVQQGRARGLIDKDDVKAIRARGSAP